MQTGVESNPNRGSHVHQAKHTAQWPQKKAYKTSVDSKFAPG